MCLRTKMQEAKRANRPIYCYKILVHFHCESTETYEFLSPVQYHPYTPGVIMKLGDHEHFPLRSGYKPDTWANISHGFHSFVSLESIGLSSSECRRKNYVIALCRIPVGAMYWMGNRGGWGQEKYDEYCSDQIEFVAWKYQGEDEWRRPMLSPYEERPSVSILKGLTITEAKERLGYWYLCESCQLVFNVGWYVFNRVGTYGRLELRTYCNRVTDVV